MMKTAHCALAGHHFFASGNVIYVKFRVVALLSINWKIYGCFCSANPKI